MFDVETDLPTGAVSAPVELRVRLTVEQLAALALKFGMPDDEEYDNPRLFGEAIANAVFFWDWPTIEVSADEWTHGDLSDEDRELWERTLRATRTAFGLPVPQGSGVSSCAA